MIHRSTLTLPGRGVQGALMALGVLLWVLLWLPTGAEAGPLADAIMARRTVAQGGGAQELLDANGDAGEKWSAPSASRVEKDVAYGPDPAQRLDVYLPQPAKAAPIVFMVHGGAWMVGSKAAAKVVNHKAAHWLANGFVFVSIDYRMSRSPKVLDQIDDVARALAFVQAQAPAWGADPARILLMGHSAGAHLVSLLTADPALAAAQGARPWLGTVSLDSAVLDVSQTMQEKHYRLYDQVFGHDPAYWAATSPSAHLHTAPVAPMMLVCSTRRDDACPQAQNFAAKVNSVGGKASVLPMDLSHGAINGDLGLPTDYTRAVDGFIRSVGIPTPSR